MQLRLHIGVATHAPRFRARVNRDLILVIEASERDWSALVRWRGLFDKKVFGGVGVLEAFAFGVDVGPKGRVALVRRACQYLPLTRQGGRAGASALSMAVAAVEMLLLLFRSDVVPESNQQLQRGSEG